MKSQISNLKSQMDGGAAHPSGPESQGGFRWRIVGLAAAGVVLTAAAAFVLVHIVLRDPLREAWLARTETLNRTASAVVRSTREDVLGATLAPLTADPDLAWLEIYRSDGTLAFQHLQSKPPTAALDPVRALPTDRLQIREEAEAFDVWSKLVTVTIHEDGSTAESIYFIRSGITKNFLSVWSRRIAARSGIALGAVALLLIAVSLPLAARLVRPINEMAEIASGIGRGDFRRLARDDRGDEVGALARNLNLMLGGLAQVLDHTHAALRAIRDTSEYLQSSAAALKDGSAAQREEFESTRAATTGLAQVLHSIAGQTETIEQSASHIGSSVHELTTSVREMKKYFATLSDLLAQTVTSIRQMAASIAEVAQSAKTLKHVSEESTLATKSLAAKTDEISRRSLDTARLSRDAQAAAERGSEILKNTLSSSNEIFQTFTVIKDHTQILDTELRKITEVVQVIEDLADRTNILSLNAAIIAAQAREHGKGFMVVADEIKKLATSTTHSLRVIESTVSSVQDKGVQVRKAVEMGEDRVKRGIGLSEELERSLREILEALAVGAEMAQEISKLTQAQKESTDGVRITIEQVDRMARSISTATGEQAQTSETINRSCEELRDIADRGTRMIAEQSEAGNTVAKGVETIVDLSRALGASKSQGLERYGLIELAVEKLEEVALLSLENIDTMRQKIDELARLAETLEAEISRFNVPGPSVASSQPLPATPSTLH
ncbi:MAG: HAMP domain-containing protein [Nitrospirae bacterium]|nr:HAMP domain-containing protein [Nitrospirota bacterium]